MSELGLIGVDTGGTFTDCVLYDHETAELRVAKVPSQPERPHAAILDGIQRLGDGAVAVGSVTHGTTIATNAVLTGDLARAGMITTSGCRDVLEIGTQMRPKLYDLRQQPRQPLITRDLRLEVGGRVDAAGREIEPLDLARAAEAVDRLLEAGVEAIAVAGLFSFVNPEHERAIQALVAERAPELYVGCSAQIIQEPREYPRFATAAVNAALAPRLDPYIRGLESRLQEDHPGARLLVMQSNGGVGTAARSMGQAAHQLILSGPAGGVIGGAREAATAGFDRCVTFDVGGTSADVGIVIGAGPRSAVDMTLPDGVPCKVPHIEVVTIGAGGGSIATVDAGGALAVGPQSAGAEPGPACYGRGGDRPTVTDAQLVLGRLSTRGLIGGRLTLDAERARGALADIGNGLGLELEAAALGVLAVLEENMAGAIRRAAARHGDDLRDFALVAGGGAGPLHAASIVGALGMRAAIIPRHPGLLSALGLLGSPLRHDLVAPLIGLDVEPTDAFTDLEREADVALAQDGVTPDDRSFERALDIRYVGQEHAVRVPVGIGEPVGAALERFHEQHERTFGHAAPEVATELVAARLIALGRRPVPMLRDTVPAAHGDPVGSRAVRFAGHERAVETAVHARSALGLGQRVAGPAIVEQLDATTIVPPGAVATVHESGALIIEP